MAPDAALAARARSAYERGRWGVGLTRAAPAALIAGVALLLHGMALACVAAGAALLALVAVFGWRGGEPARVTGPALLVGLLPFCAPAASRGLGHACVAAGCISYCLIACVVSGLVAGFVFAARTRPRGSGWWAGAAVLALTGSLGCAYAGVPGLLGMLVGSAVGAVPAALWVARTQRA